MKKLILLSLFVVGTLVADSFYELKGVAPVKNELYKSECASCHFAYQPGLLPAKSWIKLMQGLENHFKTDASLESEDNQKILNYLLENSAEKSTQYKRSKKINNSITPDELPIAVTQTKYFIKKHRKISPRIIEQKEVKSLANCTACHTTAEKGFYKQRDIHIPNYGRYEDD